MGMTGAILRGEFAMKFRPLKFKSVGLIAGAVLMASLVATNANAASFHTYDFIDYIDHPATYPSGGEHAVIADFSITSTDLAESHTITAHGSIAGSGVPGSYSDSPYAYFDKGKAGIGVCKILSGTQCAPASDDNITGGAGTTEILSLGFAGGAGLADLLFRNDGHTPTFPDNKHVLIGSGTMAELAAGTVLFTQYLLGAVSADTTYDGSPIGATIGFGPFDLLDGQFVHIKFDDQQVYLSGLITYPVPVPAALPLFLSGLLGLGVVARRRKQKAAV